MKISQNVIDWLVELKGPSIRYRTLRELLDESNTNPDVIQARNMIPESKKVEQIFKKMHPKGYWLH
jgi:hypothetical protein